MKRPSTEMMDRLGDIECEKNAILNFLEWAQHKYNTVLATRVEISDTAHSYWPATVQLGKTSEGLVLEYLGIDQEALDEERRKIIEELRQRGER